MTVGAKTAGRVLLVGGAAISAYNIASAPEGYRVKAVAQESGAWVGALSFGAAGAKVGGAIGTFFGPRNWCQIFISD